MTPGSTSIKSGELARPQLFENPSRAMESIIKKRCTVMSPSSRARFDQLGFGGGDDPIRLGGIADETDRNLPGRKAVDQI